jgi:uncharacterized protein (TIGR01244 family)
MTDFRRLSETVLASPQIGLEEIAAAKAQGVTLVINNRPEGEADDQTPGPDIEAAARAAGLDYRAIPITPGRFSEPEVAAMAEALDSAQGMILAYCRSGTRSSLLWALAKASRGSNPDALAQAAAAAGYDVAPVRPAMDMLAARARD